MTDRVGEGGGTWDPALWSAVEADRARALASVRTMEDLRKWVYELSAIARSPGWARLLSDERSGATAVSAARWDGSSWLALLEQACTRAVRDQGGQPEPEFVVATAAALRGGLLMARLRRDPRCLEVAAELMLSRLDDGEAG